MDDLGMPSFPDPRDVYSLGSQSCTLSPADRHFDTPFGSHSSFSSDTSFSSGNSFSSPVSSFNQCITPTASRRGSSNIIDVDGLLSCPNSLGSNVSNSPMDHGAFHRMAAFTLDMKAEEPSYQSAKAEVHGFNDLYATPRSKRIQDQQMITPSYQIFETEANDFSHLYNTPSGRDSREEHMTNLHYSEVSNKCGAPDLHENVAGIPELMYGNLPGPFHENPTPSMTLASSPSDFVIPSKTFKGHPYRPTTPVNTLLTQLALPLANYGRPSEVINYFMSPPTRGSQQQSLGFESPSRSSSERKPSKQTLERLTLPRSDQVISGHIIRRQRKRPEQLTAKIERVAAGLFHCEFEGCKSKHGFKRHEHLNRHNKTHLEQKKVDCPFCKSKFSEDRTDNWRSHVKLHSNPNSPRTPYFEGAVELVKEWEKAKALKKLRTQGVRKETTRRDRISKKPSSKPS